MFTFGALNAQSVTGLRGVLVEWPGMPSVALHTIASPGRDGVYYADSTLPPGRFVFDLLAEAATAAGALAIAERVARDAPRRGEHTLTTTWAPGWAWSAVMESLSNWAHDGWDAEDGYRLRAQLTLATPDPYGYATPDESWALTSGTITRTLGNTDSYPTITITGTLTAGQTVTLTLGDWSITLDGPLAGGQELILDYQRMDFGIWNGATKVASAVARMSRFDRPALPMGATAVSATSTGTLAGVTIKANSRRI